MVRSWRQKRKSRIGVRRFEAFTLLELLVVVAILALLMSLVVGAIRSVRVEAKTLLCLNNMRTASLSFRLFADPYAHPYRGDSETMYGSRFSAWDFQESLYLASEFWRTDSDIESGRRVYKRGREAVVCSEVTGELACVSPGFGLESGRAVAPARNIGYAMNRRLLYAPYERNGFQMAKFVPIGDRVLDHPLVPLLFDVDAEAAVTRWGNAGPFFSAPAGKTPSIYDGPPSQPEPFWFPATRHKGKIVIAFLGGHVIATTDPMSDPTWDWTYHPPLAP